MTVSASFCCVLYLVCMPFHTEVWAHFWAQGANMNITRNSITIRKATSDAAHQMVAGFAKNGFTIAQANNNEIFLDSLVLGQGATEIVFNDYVLVAVKRTSWWAPVLRLLGSISTKTA